MTTMATKHHMKHYTRCYSFPNYITGDGHLQAHSNGFRNTHTSRSASPHTYTNARDFAAQVYIYRKLWTSLYTHIYSQSDGLRYVHIYLQAMDFAYTHIFTSDGFRCTLVDSDAMDFAAHTHSSDGLR
ncbi:hypothetical protein BDD12DRAFT_331889 [Trichophaea hybrida]|nr:hypothetical protein BDD12DRAFT_331889 [Trichophaea hybrida]